MMTHLFLSDVDGTLLNNDVPIPDAVVRAAAKFKQAGGGLCLCTGRAPISARAPARRIGVNCPSILWGGPAIYDFDRNECLWKRSMPGEILDSAARCVEKYPKIALLAYTERDIYFLRRTDYILSKGIPEEMTAPQSPISAVSGEVIKIVLAGENIEELGACISDCFTLPGIHAAFSSRHFVEVVADGANKGAAMEALCELLQIPLANTFAAGDGMTDLSMLSRAGFAYTLPHAPKALKDVCNMVIPSFREGGMEAAFENAESFLKGNAQG
ncbi:MAG: HAD family hydrolase [Oscillospiraceae bacterium]